jgi:hypothetical protein
MNTVIKTNTVVAVNMFFRRFFSSSGRYSAPSSNIRDRAKEKATAPLKPLYDYRLIIVK